MTDTECSICLENLLDTPETDKKAFCVQSSKHNNEIIKLPCSHCFHYGCVVKIKDNNCPLCRRKILLPDLCEGNHTNSMFNISYFKKDGTCRFCSKKSFTGALKDLIIP